MRSPASEVISAGIALNGTWKNAYAVAHSRNATSTQTAASAGGAEGPAKISANVTASATPARIRNGLRRPCGDRLRSLIRPAIGFSTTSHAFGTNTINPATTAATPSVSVRYGSSSRPGTVPNVPVATLPIA